MKGVLRSVGPLLLGIGMVLLASGLFNSFLSLRMGIEAFPPQLIGFVVSAYFAGFLFGSLWTGAIVAQVGHIRAFAAFAAILTGSFLFLALFVSPWAWMAIRVLSGFAIAGIFVVTESWLNDRADSGNRGSILSLYMIVNQLASGLGQQLLQAGDPAGPDLFLIAGALLSVALVPVALSPSAGPPPPSRNALSLLALYRISPLGVVGCFAVGLSNAAFYSLAPLFGHSLGLSVAAIAQFMTVTILAGMVMQWPIGRLSDRRDRRHIIAGVTAGVVVAAAAIAVAGAWSLPLPLLLGLVAVYGGLSLTVYPLMVAHANDFTGPGQRVAASAGLLLAYGIGAVIGPIVAANLMGFFGPQALFAYVALIAAGLCAFTVYRIGRRAPVPVDARDAFVPVAETTAAPRPGPGQDAADVHDEPSGNERAEAPRSSSGAATGEGGR
ncbi:MFS transporter [Allostella sp. ATCC 35155]|nr:MFS transporter [Stella sp. ATCC 35155]